ncbi:4Fe-4S binding protein [Chloroflexota bacterium]
MATRTMGPSITVDTSKCTGCLACELRCSLRFEKAFSPAMAAIKIRRLVDAADEYGISFSDKCDNCGICVRYCSYGALTQEQKRGGA